MATQQEVIKKFMASLDTTKKKGTAALDEAIQACSNFKSAAEAIEQMVKDCKNAVSGTDFLKNSCGINLDNTDTGAITGSDAGGSTTKTATSIVPETKSATNFTGTSFTVNGLTVKLGKAYANLSSYEKYLWNNLHEHWIKNTLDLIAQSYGDNFSFNSTSSVREMTVTFFDEIGGDIAVASPTFSDSSWKTVTGLTLKINLAYYKSDTVSAGDSNGIPNSLGTYYNVGYLDRNIAHELTHAVMLVNIEYGRHLPLIALEGMAELTHGADDTMRNSDIKALAADSSKLNQALNGTTVISGVNSPTYAGGYMFLRWLAKQATKSGSVSFTEGNDNYNNTVSNVTLNALGGNDSITNSGSDTYIFGDGGNDTIRNYAEKSTLAGGTGDDSIQNGSNGNKVLINSGDGKNVIDNGGSNVTINGGSDSDKIFSWSNAKNVVINSGDGDDTIYTHGSNNKINGGKGNDYIWNNATQGTNVLFTHCREDGNDIIVGFNATSTLSISGAAFSKTKSSDNKDWLVKVGNDTITLQGAASLTSPNIVSDYKPSTFTEGNDNYNNTVSNVTLNALGGNDSINNTGSNVVIYGNSGNDSVRNAYGNNVAINTGAGKDSVIAWGSNIKINDDSGDNYVKLYADAKNVTVLTGDGKDSIYTGGQTVSVNAGSDNDYIHIYKQAVKTTVTGGVGDDTIKNYSENGVLYVHKPGDGNDSIWGFNETSTLRFGSSTNVSLQTKKTDVIVTVGKGKITLSGAASLSAINIQGSAKNDSIRNTVSGAKIDARGGNDKIYNYASGKVTLSGGSGDDTITNWGGAASMDGCAGNDLIWGDSGKDTLTGGAGNDKLHGEEGNDKIYGGSGNDSLWGGDGNDSLWGGSGKDVFIYKPGEGKDRIFDYSSGDMLKILEDDGSKGSFKKSKYSGGDLTLTISGGGTVIFDGVSKGDKFNINGTTYKISGSKLVKK